jgi:thiol:disulfide interchange protein DsbD
MGMKNKIKILSICLLLLLSLSLYSQFQDEKVMPEVEAKVLYQESKIIFNFSLDNNYHFANVKNDMFNITLGANEYFEIKELIMPKGRIYDGEIIYKGNFEVTAKINQLKEWDESLKAEFKIDYQICQEAPEEMCLAPESLKLEVILKKDFASINAESDAAQEDLGFLERMEKMFNEKMKQGSLLVFLFAFIAGFLASLTPCVYPVIPIVMGYVGSKSKDNKLRGFYLSIFFALGLSLVYSILGVIAASPGSFIGVSFQSPVVIIVIASIFILMGLSLAGLFEIPIPSSISSKVQASGKGGIVGAMLVGGVSAVIAAPCVGPILLAIVAMIIQTGNLFYGFLLIFTFSMGLSVLFIIAGTFSGVISSMPKGGKWMTYIKYIFAILLIVSGIFVLSKVLPVYVIMMVWGVFLISLSVLGGVFSLIREEEMKGKILSIILILLLLMGSLLFIKGINMKFFNANEVSKTVNNDVEKLPWMSNLEEALKRAQSEDKIIMLDSYTDWCVTCKKLDKKTFQDSEVTEALNKIVIVKINFTLKDEANSAIKEKYQILGFPTVLFLDRKGEVIDRFSTFLDKRRFLKKLKKAKDKK